MVRFIIGFSGVFEIFTLVSILDYFRSISGTDHSEPCDVDGGISWVSPRFVSKVSVSPLERDTFSTRTGNCLPS